MFVPEAYDRSVEYPTILFLHGAGQTGSNGELQAQGGLGEAIRKRQSNFPFIAVFPQSRQGTWSSESPDGKRAIQVLEEVRK